MTSTEIIEKLGGTAEVARLCQVQMPSVSEWKSNGIPKARLMYLRAVRPEIFAVTSTKQQRQRKEAA